MKMTKIYIILLSLIKYIHGEIGGIIPIFGMEDNKTLSKIGQSKNFLNIKHYAQIHQTYSNGNT